MKISLSNEIIIDRVYVPRGKISKQALVGIHSSVGGGTGRLGPWLFCGYFSVWLNINEIGCPKSYKKSSWSTQLLFLYKSLF